MGLAGDGARGSIVHDFGLSISNFEGWNNLTRLDPYSQQIRSCSLAAPKIQKNNCVGKQVKWQGIVSIQKDNQN